MISLPDCDQSCDIVSFATDVCLLHIFRQPENLKYFNTFQAA
ncbi:hypothetical protein ACKLNO_09160 [Neisseriaceae bacterium B1]